MASATPSEFTCSICNWPVDLKTCKTDEAGKCVHEDCYMLRELLKNATQEKTFTTGVKRKPPIRCLARGLRK